MRSHWKDMDPVDDFVTQQTPGLKIWTRSGAACSAPTTSLPRVLTSRSCWRECRDGLCGVPHQAYVISGTLKVIYKDGTVDLCTRRGSVLLAGSAQLHLGGRRRDPPVQRRGGLAAQAKVVEESVAKMKK